MTILWFGGGCGGDCCCGGGFGGGGGGGGGYSDRSAGHAKSVQSSKATSASVGS